MPSKDSDDTYDDIDVSSGSNKDNVGDVGEFGSTKRSDETPVKGPSKPFVKKKRKVKDPNAPKRPATAFIRFAHSRRKVLKLQYPDATMTDISKMLSKMWNESETDFRQKFIDEAAEMTSAWKEEMVKWRLRNST